jgi:hypothetical protein
LLKEKGVEDDDAGVPKLNDVDGAGVVVGLLPKENEGVSAGFAAEPKLKLGVDAGVVVEGGPTPILKPEPLLPKPNPVGLPLVGVLPDAPPKANCGFDPPGPNLPNLAGGVASSSLADGVKDLLSGVEGLRGALGAKANRLGAFLVSEELEEGVALNEKAGVGASVDLGAAGSDDLLEMASSTSLVTSAEGFFVLLGGGAFG